MGRGIAKHDARSGDGVRRHPRHDRALDLGSGPLRPGGAFGPARIGRLRHCPGGASLSRLQQRHRHHHRLRPRRQRRDRPLGARRDADEAVRAEDDDQWDAGGGAGVRRDGAFRLHQEYRRRGDLHPDRAPGRSQDREAAIARADAARLRFAARRAHHPDRHVAQHHRVADARADHRRAVSHVRLRAGGHLPGGRGGRLPHGGLAAAAEDQEGDRRDARDPLLDRGLCHRGAPDDGFACHWQDRSGTRGARRWRRHGGCHRPRGLPSLRSGWLLAAVRGRHPHPRGRHPRALKARR